MRSLTCVSVVVCVLRKPRPCPSYSRCRDRINLGLLCSYQGGGGGGYTCLPYTLADPCPHPPTKDSQTPTMKLYPMVPGLNSRLPNCGSLNDDCAQRNLWGPSRWWRCLWIAHFDLSTQNAVLFTHPLLTREICCRLGSDQGLWTLLSHGSLSVSFLTYHDVWLEDTTTENTMSRWQSVGDLERSTTGQVSHLAILGALGACTMGGVVSRPSM